MVIFILEHKLHKLTNLIQANRLSCWSALWTMCTILTIRLRFMTNVNNDAYSFYETAGTWFEIEATQLPSYSNWIQIKI